MKVAVYDTYVTRNDGEVMHFDIIVASDVGAEKVLEHGRQFLSEVGQGKQPLSSKECRFCHMEQPSPAVLKSISTRGYHIEKMEGCE